MRKSVSLFPSTVRSGRVVQRSPIQTPGPASGGAAGAHSCRRSSSSNRPSHCHGARSQQFSRLQRAQSLPKGASADGLSDEGSSSESCSIWDTWVDEGEVIEVMDPMDLALAKSTDLRPPCICTWLYGARLPPYRGVYISPPYGGGAYRSLGGCLSPFSQVSCLAPSWWTRFRLWPPRTQLTKRSLTCSGL